MAVLSPPYERVETTAGVAVSGGKLRVYNINTTTLSTLYSDEAMATPLTNPVVADSNGMLPMIFCAAGTYDIKCLTAASVEISGTEKLDYPTIGGSTANTISSTLSGARILIDGGDIGDGAIGARINAGDPSPDVSGGNLRLGGWGATQGDKLIVDFDSADFKEPGSLKEAGQRIAETIATSPTAFSAVANVDIALPETPPNTRAYEIILFDLINSATASPCAPAVRFSFDNAATYKSGASDYAFLFTQSIGTGPATNTVHDDAETYARMQTSYRAKAGSMGLIRIKLWVPDSGAEDTVGWGTTLGTYDTSDTVLSMSHFHIRSIGGHGRPTHIRIYDSNAGGTFTGSYVVLAGRGYGE